MAELWTVYRELAYSEEGMKGQEKHTFLTATVCTLKMPRNLQREQFCLVQ